MRITIDGFINKQECSVSVFRDGLSMTRTFESYDEAFDFKDAVNHIGVVAAPYEGELEMVCPVTQCERAHCRAWLRDGEYYSDERCNTVGLGRGIVLCEAHAHSLAKLSDAEYAAMARSGQIRSRGRLDR